MRKKFTKNLFENLYNKQKKSIRKIALELKVGKTSIEYYLKKFKIKRRTYEEARKLCSKEYGWTRGLTKETDSRLSKLAENIKKAYIKKKKWRIKKTEEKFGKPIPKLINKLYWEEGLSQERIAKKLGFDRRIIIELMKELNIKKRPRYQYISSLKGKNHALFGRTWESLLGKEKTKQRKKEHSERFRKIIIRRLKNNEFPFLDTRIERIMAKELLKREIPFVKQFQISNKFVCDFAIPAINLIIECDGDYWHANPKIYNKEKLTLTQKKNLQRDKFKDKFLNKQGWKVLRFYESDIRLNIAKVMIQIEKNIR